MKSRIEALAVAAALAWAVWMPSFALAHCDTLDGPVVQAARVALEHGDVTPTLVWVKAPDEPAIRDAFQRTLAVRKLGTAAKELADRWFFETLVRLHRAGEGAPYTGLKPAGTDFGPAIPAADRALETGNLAPLLQIVDEASHRSLEARFQAARATKSYGPREVEKGREYVEAYVRFIHQAEGLWQAAAHGPEAAHGETAQE